MRLPEYRILRVYLDGASAEFFVRCRHGDGYANSDIDRLNMQRYFYAGLFKRCLLYTSRCV